jgi:hypothetical protein
MNDEKQGRGRSELPNDPQGRDPGMSDIFALAAQLQKLNQRAAAEFAPVVEHLIRSDCRDVLEIERLLDRLLDFCGHDPVLLLYRRLCRHLWDIDPAAAAAYVRFYREMWDEASLPEENSSEQ